MKQGFRQINAWLHGWSGLILGWLLFAVFLTGAYSFFREEITWWMQPELHGSVSDEQTPERALAKLAELAPNATSWSASLPGDRGDAVRLSWREQGAPAAARGGPSRYMDAGTGELLTPRETSGGEFLYRFHFELHAMPRIWGRWIVGIATMAMFVAIITGIITHKKIFTDFFTFRAAKGQRSWLDAHNVTAVLSLPFHIMITYSGLILLAGTLMPWGNMAAGVQGRGGGGGAPPAAATAPAVPGPAQAAAAQPEAGRGQRPMAEPGDGDEEEGGNRRGGGGGRRGERGEAPIVMEAAFAPLAPMLAVAEREWGQPAGRFTLNNPTGPKAVLELAPRYNANVLEGGGGGTSRMRFDARSGALLETVGTPERSLPRAISSTLNSLHRGRFAEPVLRWIYFLAGVGGTLMVATGLVLWSVKRAGQLRGAPLPFGQKLVAHLNVGAVAGMPVAIAAHFWANRLLPVGIEGRPDWEINVFFLVWLLTFLHPLLRPLKRAWIEQLLAAAALLVLLPLLNGLTTPYNLVNSLLAGRWLVAGFDATMLLTGAMFAYAAWKVQRHKPNQKAGKAKPVARPDAAAMAAE